VLEKRQDGSKKWQKVASNIGFKETKVMARNLTRGCEYDFRLVAVNEMGDSDPLRTSAPIKAEFPFSKSQGLSKTRTKMISRNKTKTRTKLK